MPLQITGAAAPAVAMNLCSSRKGKLGPPSEICSAFPIHLPFGKCSCRRVLPVSVPAFQLHHQCSFLAEEGKDHIKSDTSSATMLPLYSPLRITVGEFLQLVIVLGNAGSVRNVCFHHYQCRWGDKT